MPNTNTAVAILVGVAGAGVAWDALQGRTILGYTVPPFPIRFGATPSTSGAATTTTAAGAAQLFTLPTPMSAAQIASAAQTTIAALDAANQGSGYQYMRTYPNRMLKAGTTVALPQGANLGRLLASAQSLAGYQSGRVS
jgi:hypothetical protein